mgnify:CR=1 FL=1
MCRLEMKNTMRIISIPISLNLQLNGSNTLTQEENTHLFIKRLALYYKEQLNTKCIEIITFFIKFMNNLAMFKNCFSKML